ncbi:MAG: hypothetical protein V8R58_00820 [Faecalibacillus faecis]
MISQTVLRLSVGLLEDYKNKHKMIMLIRALSSGCVSLFLAFICFIASRISFGYCKSH